MIINLISGPRNISTALMYAFAQREDTVVMDEPFYGHYLVNHDVQHPGRKEIIATMPHTFEGVLERIETKSKEAEHIFLKNMGHHLIDIDISFMNGWCNIFLIRDPKQLIASFAQVIPDPTIQDIGLKRQAELFELLRKQNGTAPIVIDSNLVLANPELMLTRLCKAIDIAFESTMLTWEPGVQVVDVPWAKYWYKNVQASSGFAKQKTSNRPLPERCQALYQVALPYYNLLVAHAISI
ncbi:MAG: hypothetical protein KJP00_02290 [Bacteroidia bacterium]|nr:hypothetical protein [Bacteroidia bacterium]